MLITIAIISVTLMFSAYILFKDTMNRIQYIERLSLYWITRDNGTKGTPFLALDAFMRQTEAPYWRGTGWQFRVGSHTFQVGRLTMKVDSLESQISNKPALLDDTTPKDYRKW